MSTRAQLINEVPERTFALILQTGNEVVSTLERFAAEQRLEASRITAIGAFTRVTLGYFDWGRKDYDRIELTEQLEVLSLIGDIALQDRKPKLHAHVVLGRRDASTCGGHLLHAIVRPTLEILLTDSPAYLRRAHDPASGLALIRIGT
ncbi:MAG TPA: PPC domain-containing DNA-binding protein [Burkholderiaceae bacterium]|nr:PPC domain-containing DNA-binding protein [Burkholderiaceae bacterium]